MCSSFHLMFCFDFFFTSSCLIFFFSFSLEKCGHKGTRIMENYSILFRYDMDLISEKCICFHSEKNRIFVFCILNRNWMEIILRNFVLYSDGFSNRINEHRLVNRCCVVRGACLLCENTAFERATSGEFSACVCSNYAVVVRCLNIATPRIASSVVFVTVGLTCVWLMFVVCSACVLFSIGEALVWTDVPLLFQVFFLFGFVFGWKISASV